MYSSIVMRPSLPAVTMAPSCSLMMDWPRARKKLWAKKMGLGMPCHVMSPLVPSRKRPEGLGVSGMKSVCMGRMNDWTCCFSYLEMRHIPELSTKRKMRWI